MQSSACVRALPLAALSLAAMMGCAGVNSTKTPATVPEVALDCSAETAALAQTSP
jgi:hypothetical protein